MEYYTAVKNEEASVGYKSSDIYVKWKKVQKLSFV